MKKRPFKEIAASILKRTLAEPLNISRIVYAENLSYTEAKRCIDSLSTAGLIETVPNAKTRLYVATERGQEFLRHFRRAIELFEGKT